MNNVLLLFLMIIVALSCPVYAVDVTIPVANFTGNLTTGAVPLTVTFADTSTGNPTGWAWYFGDETYTAPWTQLNTSAGWTRRTEHSSVAMPDGSIVLMGGITPSGGYMNDVWRSTDNGATWMLVNASAGWIERVRHSSVAMPDGSILLMGGWWYSDNQANDVWRSTDNGATWMLVNASAGWIGRWSHTSVAMPDGSIVLMGGLYGGSIFFNDTWRLNPTGSSAQSPSHTYTVPGIYNVALQVYNTNGYNSNRKTGYINVTPSGVPDTSFTVLPSSGIAPLIVQFNDTSANFPSAWNWSFRNVTPGNNTQVWFSTVQSSTHTFGVGNYSIVLNSSNSLGYNHSTQVTFINISPNTMCKIGIFRPTEGFWSLDSNGNHAWDVSDTSLSWGLPGDIPIVGDWNGDGKDDIGIFRSSNGMWSLDSNGNFAWEVTDVSLSWGLPNDNPVIGDWNGDKKDDIGIFRSSNGMWSLDSNGNNVWDVSDTTLSWGLPGDIPIVGDWNGDGKDDVGIFRPSSGMWSLDSNGDLIWEVSDASLCWGLTNDLPVIGDWNGDGKDDIGIFRPSSGMWSLDSNGNFAWEVTDVSLSWGLPGDIPIVGDWNGDGKDDIGIFRSSNGMWSLDSNGNFAWEVTDVSLSWGLPNDNPVIGDWNGDKKDDIGIFRSSNGMWSLDSNGNNVWDVSDTTLSWGLPGDIPIVGDWNGDGKDDVGIFRPSSGMWSLDSNGDLIWEVSDASLCWGLTNDLPVIGDWNGDGKDDIGIFRPSSGMWSLDSNGNNAWDVSDTSLSWGLPNDKPAVGKY
jgi:PKD repeat protein